MRCGADFACQWLIRILRRLSAASSRPALRRTVVIRVCGFKRTAEALLDLTVLLDHSEEGHDGEGRCLLRRFYGAVRADHGEGARVLGPLGRTPWPRNSNS